MQVTKWITSLPAGLRILLFILLAFFAHLAVREFRQFSRWLLTRRLGRGPLDKENFARRYPKFATVSTVLVSAITFSIYFVTVGFMLKELKISLTTYLASASVIGLAIGFGLQGFVQDLIIGLTLIFSDSLNIGDIVEITGQIGKVDYIGLRFTTLVNIHGQKIYIPNRNIGIIGNFRRGAIRAYVDIQLPEGTEGKHIIAKIEAIAKGMYDQHRSIILEPPDNLGVHEAQWKFLRLKFKLWPGQGAVIETTFKQSILTLMKSSFTAYLDWMITVTYQVS